MAAPILTDDQVHQVLKDGRGQKMTYVVRNILEMDHKFRRLSCAPVLRALRRLERAGKVRQVPTSYAVQLCWEAVA